MTELVWDGKPIKRACSGCGSLDWTELRSMIEGTEFYDTCSECLVPVQTDGVKDVYFRHPYESTSLGVEFTSKKQKAAYLAKRGFSEAGDRKLGEKSWVEGSRDYRKRNFEKARPLIRENYRKYLDNVRKTKGG